MVGEKPRGFYFFAFSLGVLVAGRPRFRLLLGLTVGLAIGGAVSVGGEVAVGLVGCQAIRGHMTHEPQ